MVTALAKAIDELLELDVDALDDGSLHDEVVALQRLDSLAAAARARFVSVWEARKVWTSDGSKSPSARLARDTHCSPATARAEVRRACRLRTMPHSAKAFATGTVSTDHVELLAGCNRPPWQEAFAEGEAELVDDAKTMAFENFQRAIRYWQDAADDDTAEDRAQRRYDQRYLAARETLGGMVDVQGRLDPVNGAIFTGELRRLERQMFEADWAVARELHGDSTQADHLARTSEQRHADALVEMARRSAALPADARPARIVLTVLVGYETFAGRVCELANGTVVTPGEVARLFGDTHGHPETALDAERIVFAGPSRVLDVGARTRVFSGALRRAIEVRDRHCTHPGCDTPASECDVDHIIEHCDNGPTTQDNGRLLCPTHNRRRPGRSSPPPNGP